jgi:hypothetical protein
VVAASDNALRIKGRDAKSVVILLAFEFEREEVGRILVFVLSHEGGTTRLKMKF